MSCSPKRYLAAAADGSLRAGPVERDRFEAWARRYQLRPCGPNAWIEEFFCEACRASLYWQVQRSEGGAIDVQPLPNGVRDQLRRAERLR